MSEHCNTDEAKFELSYSQQNAIEQWLEFGELLFRQGIHLGYYSGNGWAAEQLRSILKQGKS